MTEHDDFWDFYWETRLLPMENLGKWEAIQAASGLVRKLAREAARPVRLLELGCGQGEVIGQLLDAHHQLCSSQASAGVDYDPRSLASCRRSYPGLRCVEGDFTDPDLLAGLGAFDLVLLVNALHEVYSDAYSPELGEIDIPVAKGRVEAALAGAAGCLGPGGRLVLFDGLEPPGDPQTTVRIRFRDPQARQEFGAFAGGYHPFRIDCRQLEDPLCIELTRRDFTRYITKSIFLGKGLWESERTQSYQYFTEAEFRAAFALQALDITELRTLTMNEEKWRYRVEIETPGVPFPDEHILILAQKDPSNKP